MSDYTPEGDKLDFTFSGVYTPDATKFNFDFNGGGGGQPSESQFIVTNSFDALLVGTTSVRLWHLFVKPTGFQSDTHGFPNLRNNSQIVKPSGQSYTEYGRHRVFNKTVYLRPNGFNAQLFGAPSVKNILQIILPKGLVATEYGKADIINRSRNIYPVGHVSDAHGVGRIYNKRRLIVPIGNDMSVHGATRVSNRFRTLTPVGFDSATVPNTAVAYNINRYISPASFLASAYGRPSVESSIRHLYQKPFEEWNKGVGRPSVWGGVQHVYPVSIDSERFGTVIVVQDKIEQYVETVGSLLSAYGIPDILPKFIKPRPFVATSYGTPKLFLRTLMPSGFDVASIGILKVSNYTTYVTPPSIDAPEIGFPKVIHRGANVLVHSEQMATSVFGVAYIYNKNKHIYPIGYAPYDIFEWHSVRTSKKIVTLKGWESERYGVAKFTKTPELFTFGFDSLSGLNVEVSAGIRTIRIGGGEQLRFGLPTVTKTPQISPRSILSADAGMPTLTNRVRKLYTASILGQQFGTTTIWLGRRYINPTGYVSDVYGTQFISHFLRWVNGRGVASSNRYGDTRISHWKQFISPLGIFKEFPHNHKVGGTQFIGVGGIYATLFGTRIIPDRQTTGPIGFTGQYGQPHVFLKRRYITPRSLNGDEGHSYFGMTNVYNLRQYITQTFIADSGLAPPPPLDKSWTHIYNRNRTVGQIGNTFTKFGYQIVFNNARILAPTGIESNPITVGLVAYRIREVAPESMADPYVSTWAIVWNTARQMAVSGIKSNLKFGQHDVRNTRRNFRYITAGLQSGYGEPMVTYRVRNIEFDTRYTIAPPIIQLPNVKLHTRYVEPIMFETARYGKPSATIHWNIVKTRWTHQELSGQPTVHNNTPEVKFRGAQFAEYGNAKVFNSRQNIYVDGVSTQLFGRTSIADKTRKLYPVSVDYLKFGQHKLTKANSPVNELQHVFGANVPWLFDLFGRPYLNHNIVYPMGIGTSQQFGSAKLWTNQIHIEYGIYENAQGEPTLHVMRRYIDVADYGIKSTLAFGKPRITPHTIYAPIGAPAQAIANHPSNNPMPINTGVKFGTLRIVNKHRAVKMQGASHLLLGTPNVFLRTNYVFVNGIRSFRMGAVNIGDGTQTIKQFASSSFAAIGWHTVSRPIDTTQRIRVSGFDSLAIGKHWASSWIREIYPVGLNSQAMGSSRGEQTLYKPQSLHVGFPMPTIPQGFNAEIFGKHWVSLKVRNVEPKGFDMFLMEYDYTAFDKRMLVTRKNIPIPTKQLIVAGINGCMFGTPDVKFGVQYIRPDGNTDNFRKGVFK